MKKLFKLIFFVFLCFFSFFMNNMNVYAFFANSESIANSFTVAPLYTDTFIYNYRDSNGSTTELGREVKKYFENTVVTINAPTGINLTGKELSTITVNGSGSYNIGDTFTQTASDMTITYTYVDENFTITYTGDTTNYTHTNNAATINYNQSYNATITLVTGREIDTVTVTMGGNNITSSAYNSNNGQINITNITGDISINVTTKLKTYTITYSGSNNYTHTNNATTINHGSAYQATISANNNYEISNVTITMGGTNITSQVFNQNNGQINISSVTGNLQINVTTNQTGGGGGICLVEGTDITLYDGSTKKIEDIKYTDLLKVWNYETGTYGYEYPAWIENENEADSYYKISLSDGSELKVVGNHSVFNRRLNKFVDVVSDELQVGDEIINLENGINYVTVDNIEVVNEHVKYYDVISTRYFNLIANNLLTTFEIYNSISNYKGFDSENLKWQIQDEVEANMLTYEEFSEFGKYLFKTFRLGEARYILEHNVATQDELNDLFYNYISSEERTKERNKDESGNYMSMVTTSDDIDKNDSSHLMVEGTMYTVPTPNNTEGFAYWYNHSDNKHYSPGDIIEVDSGIYLEAIYE